MSTYYNARPLSVRNVCMLLLIARYMCMYVCVRRCSPTNIYICVCVCVYVYSILDGNENVTVFVATAASTAAAAFFILLLLLLVCAMIVSKSFVWSKNNYADERI